MLCLIYWISVSQASIILLISYYILLVSAIILEVMKPS
jgi:hypothetical protein